MGLSSRYFYFDKSETCEECCPTCSFWSDPQSKFASSASCEHKKTLEINSINLLIFFRYEVVAPVQISLYKFHVKKSHLIQLCPHPSAGKWSVPFVSSAVPEVLAHASTRWPRVFRALLTTVKASDTSSASKRCRQLYAPT